MDGTQMNRNMGVYQLARERYDKKGVDTETAP